MADRHTIIQTNVITDWSVQKRGRLFICTQGKFRYLHTDGVITVSPYPKKNPGYPDLHGFEYIPFFYYDNYQYKEITVPVYCLVEVKTLVYPKLTEHQQAHLNYCIQIGGRAYVAMEAGDGHELIDWEVK